jgi:hypothetical protein
MIRSCAVLQMESYTASNIVLEDYAGYLTLAEQSQGHYPFQTTLYSLVLPIISCTLWLYKTDRHSLQENNGDSNGHFPRSIISEKEAV